MPRAIPTNPSVITANGHEPTVVCRAYTGGRERPWLARLVGITRATVRLFMERRFEPGTLLQIEAKAAGGDELRNLLVQVVSVKDAAGAWVMDGWFTPALDDADLQVLRNAESATSAGN